MLLVREHRAVCLGCPVRERQRWAVWCLGVHLMICLFVLRGTLYGPRAHGG
jgi:hypothetical protein